MSRQQQSINIDERAQYDDNRMAAQSSQQAAFRMAQQGNAQNPAFLAELRDAGVDDDVLAEFGSEFAGAHVTAYKEGQSHRRRIEWLSMNRAERFIAERNPGRLLKENPGMLAIAQGYHKRPGEDEKKPLVAGERRQVRAGFRAATAFQSLGADGKGLDTTGKVQTSTEVKRTSEETSKSWRERAGGIYR